MSIFDGLDGIPVQEPAASIFDGLDGIPVTPPTEQTKELPWTDPQPQNEAPGWIARGVSDLTNQMSSMRGGGTPHSPEEMQAMGQNLGGYVKSGEALKDAATYGKTAAASAVGGLVDTAALAYNLPAMGSNYLANTNLPLIPSATHAIDKAIDKATGDYTKVNEQDRYKHEALSFATQMATPGGLATAAGKKGLAFIEKGLKYLGSTKKSHVASAAVVGGATQLARDAGKDELGAIGVGLGAGVGVPLLAKGLARGAAKLVGHSPKNVDMKVVDAAVRNQFGAKATWDQLTKDQKAALDINTTLINSSPTLTNAEKYLEQVPIQGYRHKNRMLSQDRAFTKSAEEISGTAGESLVAKDLPRPEALSEVGSYTKKHLEKAYGVANQEKHRLYTLAQESLPDNAQMIAKNTIAKIAEIESQLGTKTGLGTDAKAVNLYIKDIKKDFPVIGLHTPPTPVKEIVRLKQNINDIINWDTIAAGPKENYKAIRSAFLKDIEEYGKTNPSWYAAFKEADSYYGRHLGSKALASDAVKSILKEENPEKILQNLTDASDFRDLKASLAALPEGEAIFDSIKAEKLKDLILETSLVKGGRVANYNKFSETLNAPGRATLIKHLIGDSQFEKLKDLNTIAKAQIQKANRVPNRSGTAYQMYGIGAALTGVAAAFFEDKGDIGDKLGNVLKRTTQFVGAAGIIGQIITNKRLLNYSINAARARNKNDLTAASKWNKLADNEALKHLGKEDFNILQSITKEMATKEEKKKLHVEITPKTSRIISQG